MSRTEDIDNGIWSDPDFEALSPQAKLVFIWSWTNPRCGMAGIYKVSHRTIAHECGIAPESVDDVLEELACAALVLYEDSVLWVRSRVKRLRSRSPQMAKAVAKDLNNVPASNPLRGRFLDYYGSDPWLKATLKDTPTGPTHDLSEKPVSKGNPDRSSEPSREVPGSWDGEGVKAEAVVEEQQRDELQIPGDFPDELRPHLDAVDRTLTDLAKRRRAKAVSRISLANVLMGRPHKPLVRAAHDCAGYWDGKASGPKDVVAAYRNWLDRTDDLAGVEPVGANGLPGRSGPTGGVTHLSQRQRVIADRGFYRKHYDDQGRAIS